MEPDGAEPASGPKQRLKTILQILRDGRMSVLDFLLQILRSDKADFVKHREQFFSNPSGKVIKLLDLIFRDKKGRMVPIPWMEQHATDLVIEKVVKETDGVKKALVWTTKSAAPDGLLTWDIGGAIGPLVTNQAPALGPVLQAAAKTKRARDKNKIKTSTAACSAIVTQLAKERSQHALYFAIPFALFFWTNGAPRQTIEALHKCGLGISFSSLTVLLHQLAGESLQRAARVISGPHALCWDNINIKTSIFAEQRGSAPGKSAVWNARARAKQATGLTFNDGARPTSDQRKAFHSQIRVHIINILLKFSKSFEEFERPDDPRLVHSDRRKMPDGHCTKQYPLRTSTIDESSTSGNVAATSGVYINQLKVNSEDIFNRAVPSTNDQSTNARIRAAKALRTKGTNPFTRIQFLQLGFGLLRLCMNLIWALLRAASTDYHAPLTALFQILDGAILNAWRIECGCPSLAAFASSNPSADDLVRIDDQAVQNHVSLPDQKPTKATRV
ncbi:hypothetical protein L210DRAFT_986551 [Boletus edulis BED1]|uniref:DUF6589 domain-containing protein n=1 Tax=Boletus edulis BED1 TaxID=1328754 RepID=A0AAD4BFC9_BOLED|nr:hypothetical protein L210DRAFT_986551 [Boletus edulis BED1]